MLRKVYKYSDIVSENEKVLLIGPGVPNNFGGMYSYVLLWHDEISSITNNFKLLVRKNFKINNYSTIIKRNGKSEKSQNRMKLLAVLALFLPIQILSLFFRKDYKELISSFSIVHILTASFLTYPLIKILFYFKPEIKIIYTLHDPKSHEEKISFIGKKIKEYTLKKIYFLSAKRKDFYIHLHSEKLLGDCPKYTTNIVIYPHPLPKRIIKEKYVKQNDKLRFGFLGRIESYKGLDIMFNAFKCIENELSSFVEIIIVGRGEIKKEKWENELEYDVFITNETVSDEFFHKQINSLDCLLLPYKKASQSGVGYLGLAYNIPIIASSTGGLPDVINESKQELSALVQPNDYISLVNAIQTFVKRSNELIIN